MLAKHPVAHRGDVRVVNAVGPRSVSRSIFSYRSNAQRLQLLVDNYVNVVVFSQQGARPLPNMLSGSDLVSSQALARLAALWCLASRWLHSFIKSFIHSFKHSF